MPTDPADDRVRIVAAARGDTVEVVARPEPDVVYLAVLCNGLRVGNVETRAGNPRI